MSTIPDREPQYTTEMLWHELGQQYRAGMAERAKIGAGATVPVGYVQHHARALFVAAINRIAPHVVRDLLRVENFELLEDGMTALAGDESDQSVQSDSAAATIFREHRAYIERWQEKHNLAGDWLRLAATETTVSAYAAGYTAVIKPEFLAQFPDGMPLMLAEFVHSPTVHDGRASSVDYRGCDYQVPLDIDDLREWPSDPEDNYSETFPDSFGTFDPRTEAVNAAEKRLMEALRPRLRRALEMIAADDREGNGAMGTVEFRKTTAFEWLVRFQVLGESRRQISYGLAKEKWGHEPDWERRHNPYDNTGHVGREIRKVADLIGLTLRDA